VLNKYRENEIMGQHADWNEHQSMLEYSFVVYINDDYEGGELYFQDLDVTIKPEAGSIALFPAKLPYSHGSNQLINGRKVFIPHFWRNVKS
jgi:predicted 2-oxoglutarate/Fe(II)-dependent dioxygenase YbiX